MKLITTKRLRCGINEALWQLGVEDAARRIATGELTSRALVDSCLAHIAEHEPRVHAWRHLDVEAALAQAEACDGAERPAGSLHGVPIGIKDLIDTADMPTGYGSPIYDGNRPNADATCVARLRAAGAVILGKTVTTEFATFKPPVTRNPHNVERTPGGSSSGSAVAVALSMV
ncbi:MAG: amidase, partial [Alphaproteobacteria bacterium]|nr:amidase [Alphaproteobacteria bacterium]